ncbi:MAG: PAS domain S-box protein [Chitinivibrionales bacterium]|nr:PAS domain S-box protein [Chitinivibrionales bacterium]
MLNQRRGREACLPLPHNSGRIPLKTEKMSERNFKNKSKGKTAGQSGRSSLLAGEHIRLRTLIVLHSVGILYMLIFGIKALFEGMYMVAGADIIALTVSVLNVLYLLRHKSSRRSIWIFMVLVGLLFLFLLVTGGSEGSGHLWLFGYPIAAMLLLGRRQGMPLAFSFLALVACILVLPHLWDLHYVYTVNFKLRLFGSLLLVIIIAVTYELVISSAVEKAAYQDRKYRALYNTVPIGLYQATAAGELIDANPAFAQMFGCESVEQLLKNGLFTPGMFSETVSQRLLNNEQVRGITRRFQRINGTDIFLRENIRRVKRVDSEGNETTTFEGSVEDISELKDLEVRKESYKNDLLVLSSSAVRFGAVAQSSDIYRVFAELAGTIIGGAFSVVSIYDANAGVMKVSDYYIHPCYIDKLVSMLGDIRELTMPVGSASLGPLRPGDLIEVPGGIHQLFFGAIPAGVCGSVTKSLDLGRVYTLGISWQGDVYGTASFIMHEDRVLSSEKREALEMLGRQAAVMLRRMAGESEIRRQHSFISTLIDTIPIPVFFKDRDGRYLGCNRAMEKFTGKGRDFIKGKTVWDMAPPDIAEEYARKDNEIFTNGTSQRYEWKVTRGDGELRDVKFYKAAFHTEEGEVSGLVGTFIDITEEKALLKATVRARDEAEKTSRMKMGIMSAVSHEMRTPLTAVLSLAELLHDSQVGRNSSEELLLIRRSATRLMETVENIIALTGLETGVLKINETQFDIAGLLKNINTRFSGEAREKGLEFKCEIPGKMPAVTGDEAKTAMVLQQLVSNAVKFTDSGEVAVHAAVEQNRHQQTNDIAVVFTISDTGPGIAKEIKELVYDAFFQADQTSRRKHSGSGLGLPVTQGLIVLLGGTFEMKNNNPNGTICTLRIPYKRENTPDKDAPEEATHDTKENPCNR